MECDGISDVVQPMDEIKTGDFIREFFKRWPRFYYAVALVLGPIWFVNLSSVAFLRKYPKAGTTLNVGSGPKNIAPDVINVDITKYHNVSVVAEAAHLPFEAGSVARIVSDNVLEHVAEPEPAVAEAARVLMPGGYLYVSTPFMYPFHSSPHDHTRWTLGGMKAFLERHGFEIVESGVRAGPFSVLILWLVYLCASILCFGNRRAYWFLVNVFIILFFPIKLLDVVAARLPFVDNMTSTIYVVARRK